MEPTTRGRCRDIINFEIHRLALEVLRPGEQNVLPNSSLHMWSQERFDFCLGHSADDSVDERTVLEKQHRRDRHDLKPGRRPRVLVDVQFAEAQTARAGPCDLFEDRGDPMAGAAPLGPEVDQDWVGLSNLLVKVRVRERDRSGPCWTRDLRGRRRREEPLEFRALRAASSGSSTGYARGPGDKRVRRQVEILATCPNSSAIGPIKRTSRRIRAISRSLNALGSKGTRRIDSWIATLSLRSWRRASTEPKSLWLTRYSKPSNRTTGRSLATMKCSIDMATFSGGLGRIAFFSAATRLSQRTGVRSSPYSALTGFGARGVMQSRC